MSFLSYDINRSVRAFENKKRAARGLPPLDFSPAPRPSAAQKVVKKEKKKEKKKSIKKHKLTREERTKKVKKRISREKAQKEEFKAATGLPGTFGAKALPKDMFSMLMTIMKKQQVPQQRLYGGGGGGSGASNEAAIAKSRLDAQALELQSRQRQQDSINQNQQFSDEMAFKKEQLEHTTRLELEKLRLNRFMHSNISAEKKAQVKTELIKLDEEGRKFDKTHGFSEKKFENLSATESNASNQADSDRRLKVTGEENKQALEAEKLRLDQERISLEREKLALETQKAATTDAEKKAKIDVELAKINSQITTNAQTEQTKIHVSDNLLAQTKLVEEGKSAREGYKNELAAQTNHTKILADYQTSTEKTLASYQSHLDSLVSKQTEMETKFLSQQAGYETTGAFSELKNDVQNIQGWMNELNNKGQQIEELRGDIADLQTQTSKMASASALSNIADRVVDIEEENDARGREFSSFTEKQEQKLESSQQKVQEYMTSLGVETQEKMSALNQKLTALISETQGIKTSVLEKIDGLEGRSSEVIKNISRMGDELTQTNTNLAESRAETAGEIGKIQAESSLLRDQLGVFSGNVLGEILTLRKNAVSMGNYLHEQNEENASALRQTADILNAVSDYDQSGTFRQVLDTTTQRATNGVYLAPTHTRFTTGETPQIAVYAGNENDQIEFSRHAALE